ncbi:hypothetical protein B5X24_HaOG208809 [Helicoverpa armigera]|uniref:Uncharacterized protein n=1 Tax=Helicoverpa armigera TaxID=29058 RepID=A0A2W1BM15_HELAM|nr:hypothetical protein B5X24_HaOG208809 [Helicoverpa armigera]
MKRVKESGASYRNKRKAKLENVKANEGALLKYVKSIVPQSESETSDTTLGISSSYLSQITEPLNTEQDEKVQDLDTLNLHVRSDDIISEHSIPSTLLEFPPPSPDMDMHSFETEIERKLANQYQNFDDIGKWPEVIDDNLRLYLVQQG